MWLNRMKNRYMSRTVSPINKYWNRSRHPERLVLITEMVDGAVSNDVEMVDLNVSQTHESSSKFRKFKCQSTTKSFALSYRNGETSC